MFSNFNNSSKKKSNAYGNFFLISNFDIISEDFLRLTKSTKSLHTSDFFLNRKTRNTKLNVFSKLSSFTLNTDSRDFFFQSTFLNNNNQIINNSFSRKNLFKFSTERYAYISNIFIENRVISFNQPFVVTHGQHRFNH